MTIYRPFQTENSNVLQDGGTLLWIGDRSLPEFRDAYEVGESLASQVAYRADLLSSLDRPASDVGLIVHASNTRDDLDIGLWKQMECHYTEASRLRLRGPLNAGLRSAKELNFEGTHDWHEASEAVRSRFAIASDTVSTDPPVVAVIAARYSIAEPLLDLAARCGAVSIWRREPGCVDVRGVNVVWWDDSFAGPTDKLGWRERMASMGGSTMQHAWLTQRPHWLQTEQAKQAGVDLVLGKPYAVDPLIEMLSTEAVGASHEMAQAA